MDSVTFMKYNDALMQLSYSLMYWNAHSLRRYSWISCSYYDFIIGLSFIVQSYWWGKYGTSTADGERWVWQSHSFNWNYISILYINLLLVIWPLKLLKLPVYKILNSSLAIRINTTCVLHKYNVIVKDTPFVCLLQNITVLILDSKNLWSETVADHVNLSVFVGDSFKFWND